MNCHDARLALAADPRSGERALLDHLADCDSCAAYAADMQELDRRLRDALEVPVPEISLPAMESPGPALTPLPIRPWWRPAATRLYALAASLAGVALLVGLLWSVYPRESLADAVVGHMAHEPEAWSASESLPRPAVDAVMAAAGLRLKPSAPDVVYANSCWFRGSYVPHLVVRTATGPVTVLVLPHETVERPTRIDERGYRGELVPAPRGSIAVLTRDAGDVADIAARVLAAVVFDPPPA